MGFNTKIITYSLLSVILFSCGLFLGYKYYKTYSDQKAQKLDELKHTLKPPSINTIVFPDGVVGSNYESEVIATILGVHEDLAIDILGLPNGLSMSKCKQKFDSEIVTKPNTQTICAISGVAQEDGEFLVQAEARLKGGYYQSTAKIPLSIRAN